MRGLAAIISIIIISSPCVSPLISLGFLTTEGMENVQNLRRRGPVQQSINIVALNLASRITTLKKEKTPLRPLAI
jgi:hypothetical protein